MSNGPSLTPDERPEWDDLIRSVVNGDMSSTDVTAKTHRLIDALDDAEQAHKQWAARALEEAAFNGMRAFLKSWLRSNNVAAYKAHDGTISPMSSRAGVVRDGAHAQVLFEELTRKELADHIQMLATQRRGLNDRLTAERRLMKIMDAHPEATTVGEALELDGRTLADVMGRAA